MDHFIEQRSNLRRELIKRIAIDYQTTGVVGALTPERCQGIHAEYIIQPIPEELYEACIRKVRRLPPPEERRERQLTDQALEEHPLSRKLAEITAETQEHTQGFWKPG